jgi:nucleotide-binding universal stress UspA family protein
MSKENTNVKIRKILVGIDGSVYSLKALEFALDLAKKYDSMLIAFTVFHIPEIYKILPNKESYNTISIEDEILKSKNLLKSIKESSDTNEISISTEFINSKSTPDNAILEYAQSNEVDHIVLGYRGRSIENLLIGNIATSVVSKSKCSVTVVK